MFSNDSRWDRHLPYQSREAEAIDVGVIFRKGQILPKTFVWKDRKYQVKEITYHWKDARGAEVLHYFAVSDGVNIYQIYLNSKYMHWRLEKVCPIG
jgi:hypothetical protein